MVRDSNRFTVGIVAYKNYRYIKDAVNSVFMQDYGNIELIISNDGSVDFNEKEIYTYVLQNKPENIKKFTINNNAYNLGTCKHLNKVKGMVSGQYLTFLAADDAFYDSTSISTVMKAFQENGDPLFVSGKCGMYDVDMLKCEMIVPVESVRDKLINLSPEEMYCALSTDMFIPTASTMYNMKAFDILGDFDERVFLVEDWQFYLKATRSGYKPVYINETITKHRCGGVAHGNASEVSNISKKFLNDEIAIMESELLPYKLLLGEELHEQLYRGYFDLKVRASEALFTVGIVAYKNFQYVKNAIDSVFAQDYGNIELIVSNNGSDDFNESEIYDYIFYHKPGNIKKFHVNNNIFKLNAYRHLNNIREMSSGQYIMFMDAQDALYSGRSVSRIVRAFLKNDDPLFVCGRYGAYDIEMQEYSSIAPVESVRKKLVSLSAQELYCALSAGMFIPTVATTYSMRSFDILGAFDERLSGAGKWAFFLKACRSGYKPYYLHEMIYKHRTIFKEPQLLPCDEMIVMETEILPYKSILGDPLYCKIDEKYTMLTNADQAEAALFTVGMVAYKNYRYVKEAIDSVFMQDYGNIELIVSNDGSDDFDESEVYDYILQNKPDNITEFRVNNNAYNMGTCKHLNKVKGMASGQYIMFTAADDAFYDEKSISHIVRAFQENDDPLFVCGRCGMYDVDLKEYDLLVPVDSVRDKLINLSPREMYCALSTDMFIPTAATTYNMKAFDLLGDFDERVFLVEDWALFLKATRSGYKPYYLHEIVAKHRDGGTAHGNASNVSQINQKFLLDEIVIIESELLPYKDILGKKLHKRVEARYWDFKARYAAQYDMEIPLSQKLGKLLRRSPKLVVSMLVKGVDYFRLRFFRSHQVRERLTSFLLIILTLLAVIFCAGAASLAIPYIEYLFMGVLLLFALNIGLYILGLAVNMIGLCIDLAYKLYARLFRTGV